MEDKLLYTSPVKIELKIWNIQRHIYLMKKKVKKEFLDQLKELRSEGQIKTAKPRPFIQEVQGKNEGVFLKRMQAIGYFRKIQRITTKKIFRWCQRRQLGKKNK